MNSRDVGEGALTSSRNFAINEGSRGGSCEEVVDASPNLITVVIPTLNEAEAIGKVIDELKSEGFTNILVVDGYSNDGTPQIAMERGAKVIFQHGGGKAGALRTAIEHVRTQYMLVMDGDYTYDPKDIKRLLAHAARYDEVIGARDPKNISWLHRIGNKAINFLFRLLLGANLTDVCSGMYLLRTEAVRDFLPQSRGFSVEVELAAYMSYYGRVTEVPINYRKRIGTKKLKSIRDGLAIMGTIIRLAWEYNPVFVLATIASTLAIPGAILTLWQLYLRYVYGAEAWSLGVAWLGLILLIVGLQAFTLAILSLQIKRIERRLIQWLQRNHRGR
ncbi:MAG: glycosyltransferase family 2 protein [Candidatus Nezhaarchaeales archaeon]